eukprot:COSAG01_NODE_3726_length_5760_cov_16.399399_1_plen_157_part_00
MSAQQAMSAAAKSWREKKQSGGARQSRRVVNKDLAKLESLKVPTAVKGKKRRSIKGPPLEVENCTDVESCKLQIRMLLAKKPPDWLANNAEQQLLAGVPSSRAPSFPWRGWGRWGTQGGVIAGCGTCVAMFGGPHWRPRCPPASPGIARHACARLK